MENNEYQKAALASLRKQSVLKELELPKLKSDVSPFRYPGGKAKLSPFLSLFISSNGLSGTHLVEPFCGGAGGTLPLLEAGIIGKLTLNDANPFIAEFWLAAMFNSRALIKEIRKVSVDINSWKHYREIFLGGKDAEPIDRALSVFFLNRTNRSGILHAGPIGGQDQSGNYLIDCRFNKLNLIERIKSIAKLRTKVVVKNEDASSLLYALNSDNKFVYADPPYVKEGKNIYKGFCFEKNQHETFAMVMKQASYPWLISYDDDPLVHSLYSKRGINVVELSYVMNRARVGRELLIASTSLSMPKLSSPINQKQTSQKSVRRCLV